MSEFRTIEGHLNATDHRYALVVARFNSFIVEQLVAGAKDALLRHGCLAQNVTVFRVPGAFELPIAVQSVARQGNVDGVIALGAVIRGATPHFDYLAAEATKGLGAASLTTGVPVSYGLLTCDTLEQAIERAGTKAGNKGADAATAAIEMVNLMRRIEAEG